jgi:hypothetical protein
MGRTTLVSVATSFALLNVYTLTARADNATNVWVSNGASAAVTVYRDGTQVCALDPQKSCMVAVTVGAAYTFRFVFADGVERSFVWDGDLHLCAKDGGRVTNCGPPDYAKEFGN